MSSMPSLSSVAEPVTDPSATISTHGHERRRRGMDRQHGAALVAVGIGTFRRFVLTERSEA